MEWALLALYASKVVLIMVEHQLYYSMLRSRVCIVDYIHVVCTLVKQPRHSQKPVVLVV